VDTETERMLGSGDMSDSHRTRRTVIYCGPAWKERDRMQGIEFACDFSGHFIV